MLTQEARVRAYDRVMAEHQDAVYRQIVRVCGNYDDAQDVLVETLLAAYRAMDQVRDPQAMRGWLATIGRRICRRMKQRDALAPILALDGEPAMSPQIEEQMETRRLQDCVQGALNLLPSSYRDAYMLRDVEGLTADEAANRLGINVRNLKSRLHRARKKIREALDAGICGESVER
ncbi:MAG TPA: RNA polymerase sigma factor [Fimbriimonas sp.]|nr:RNA polymerase sigma factor [Fimbriimonas sp.]